MPSNHLITSTQYFMESMRYMSKDRKFNQYDDDIVVIQSFNNRSSRYSAYNLLEQKYIVPPFDNYYMTAITDDDGYEYIAFKENNSTRYCYLLSDGSISQIYG